MENLEAITSTGNKFKDVLVGLPFGIAELNNPVGTYYVNSNYLGRGRANTGIGFLKNYEHNNFIDAAMMATANMQRNRKVNDILTKLSSLKNRSQGGAPYTLQGKLKNPPYTNYGVYSLPYQSEGMPNVSFNYRQEDTTLPDNRLFGGYNLPTQQYNTLDFNRWR